MSTSPLTAVAVVIAVLAVSQEPARAGATVGDAVGGVASWSGEFVSSLLTFTDALDEGDGRG